MAEHIKLQFQTASAVATEAMAERIGRRLKGGEVIELSSDLGGGKTTFVRGLARGAGSGDVVGSPTFTLSKVYKAARLAIYHFDFYRLQEPGIMHQELAELVGDPQLVVVVEWSDVVRDVLPEKRLTITIERTAEAEDARLMLIDCHEELAYLLEAIV